MTKRDLLKVGIIAAITFISVTLPGYLYLRGLPISWTLALIGGYVGIAVLGCVLQAGGRELSRRRDNCLHVETIKQPPGAF